MTKVLTNANDNFAKASNDNFEAGDFAAAA